MLKDISKHFDALKAEKINPNNDFCTPDEEEFKDYNQSHIG